MAPLLIAQLTDTHVVVDGSGDNHHVDNNGRLAEAVVRINAESPPMAAVLATGDLTNLGTPGEFEELRSLLDPLDAPVLPIPGNHDDRDLIRATFPDMPWVDADHASWVTEVDEVRVVGLDSTIPGQPGAEFDPDREHWLRSVLAVEHDGPTLLTVHHPPFETGIGWMDGSGFIGLDRLTAVLAEHPVDRVLSGHLHRPITSAIAGIPAQVAPATVQHVGLDLAKGAGVSLILDPVGYHVHRIVGHDIVTHTRYIAGDTAAFRPDWADEFERDALSG